MHNGRTDIQSVVVFIVDSLAGLDRVRRFPEEILLTMLFGFYVQRSAAMIGLGFLVDYLMTLLRSGLPPVPYTSDTGVWTDDDQRTLGLPDLPSPRLNIVFFRFAPCPPPTRLVLAVQPCERYFLCRRRVLLTARTHRVPWGRAYQNFGHQSGGS